jgi:hypothetical protein
MARESNSTLPGFWGPHAHTRHPVASERRPHPCGRPCGLFPKSNERRIRRLDRGEGRGAWMHRLRTCAIRGLNTPIRLRRLMRHDFARLFGCLICDLAGLAATVLSFDVPRLRIAAPEFLDLCGKSGVAYCVKQGGGMLGSRYAKQGSGFSVAADDVQPSAARSGTRSWLRHLINKSVPITL